MVRKALALLVVIAVLGTALGVVGLIRPGTADATGHSATRTFSDSEVMVGDELDITIETMGLGFAGQAEEYLPGGFTYKVSSTLREAAVEELDNGLRFTLIGVDSFTYTVRAETPVGSTNFRGNFSTMILRKSTLKTIPAG